jgi:hypothetical protein
MGIWSTLRAVVLPVIRVPYSGVRSVEGGHLVNLASQIIALIFMVGGVVVSAYAIPDP